MKSMIFTLCVVVAGYYLMAQSPGGRAWLEEHLPVAMIDSTAEQVVTEIEDKLDNLPADPEKLLQQQIQIAQLQKRVAFLEDQVQKLTMQANGHKVNTQVPEVMVAVPGEPADATDSAPSLSTEQQSDSAKSSPEVQRRIRQQHRLQEIADRMQLASVEVP